MIENGAKLNLIDRNKNTPLLIAAKNNNTEIAKLLIENGADYNAQDIN